jgi:hypothetical protein
MTNVILTGPLFHDPAGALEDIGDLIQVEVAQAAFTQVHTNLNARIQNPTPYYETQIVRQRLHTDEVVHDRGIVYGPWLEGVSRRNATTRFKGYHSFRLACQTVQARAAGIADRVVTRNLSRLGG